jgi:hypothetical protein
VEALRDDKSNLARIVRVQNPVKGSNTHTVAQDALSVEPRDV